MAEEDKTVISEGSEKDVNDNEAKAIQVAKMFRIGLNCSLCVLKPSSRSHRGIGVFVHRELPENAILRFPRPQSIGLSLERLKQLPVEFAEWIKTSCWTTTDGTVTVPLRGMHDINMEVFLTHHDTPNTRYDPDTTTYVTTHAVVAGEELTINYDQRGLHEMHSRKPPPPPHRLPSNRKKIKARHLRLLSG